jgi:hypothetical protein
VNTLERVRVRIAISEQLRRLAPVVANEVVPDIGVDVLGTLRHRPCPGQRHVGQPVVARPFVVETVKHVHRDATVRRQLSAGDRDHAQRPSRDDVLARSFSGRGAPQLEHSQPGKAVEDSIPIQDLLR